MALSNNEIKTLTKEILLKAINEYCNRNKNKKYLFKPLDLIIPYESRVRSVVGGIETSFGTNLWEKLSKELAKNNGFIIKNEKLKEPIIDESVKSLILNIIDSRKHPDSIYNAKTSNKEIYSILLKYLENNTIIDWIEPPKGHGVDIWLFKNNTHYLFDTKTVQPNLSSYLGFLTQIHHWYFYFYSKFSNQKIEAQIVFPYNPYEVPFTEKTIGGGKPLEYSKEFLCDNDFWSLITDNYDSYNIIMESFKESRFECQNIIKELTDTK